jgi:hypothetical protein
MCQPRPARTNRRLRLPIYLMKYLDNITLCVKLRRHGNRINYSFPTKLSYLSSEGPIAELEPDCVLRHPHAVVECYPYPKCGESQIILAHEQRIRGHDAKVTGMSRSEVHLLLQ